MYRPKDITDRLGISAPTLRLWSNNFSEVLSPAAQKSTTETGTAAQRRYTDEDLSIFLRAQELLNAGKTYDQTIEVLKSEPPPIVEIHEPEASAKTHAPEKPGASTPVVITEVHPIITAFERALVCVHDPEVEELAVVAACKAKLFSRARAHFIRVSAPHRTQVAQTCAAPHA